MTRSCCPRPKKPRTRSGPSMLPQSPGPRQSLELLLIPVVQVPRVPLESSLKGFLHLSMARPELDFHTRPTVPPTCTSPTTCPDQNRGTHPHPLFPSPAPIQPISKCWQLSPEPIPACPPQAALFLPKPSLPPSAPGPQQGPLTQEPLLLPCQASHIIAQRDPF